MRVLHISVIPSAGAGLCAVRINKALVNEGVDSKMLFRDCTTLPNDVEGGIATPDETWLDHHRILQRFLHITNRIFPCISTFYSRRIELRKDIGKSGENIFAHLPFSHYKNIADHPLVRWAELVHLHWVPEFVDYPTFFNKVRKPIVWTLHDMHPVLGVMHYESEWTKLPRTLDRIDAYCKQTKRIAVQGANIHPVAISQMMKNIITSSDILGQFPCELIHNGVDVNVFKPCETHRHESPAFLFSSYEIFDQRKGLERIIAALESLNLPNITLFCVGQNYDSKSLPPSRINIRHLGFIVDNKLMALIYSSVDCFINASFEEAFAQTPLEAMACGTPVISTPCSGAHDLIRDFNGVVCDGFTPDHLANGIRVFLSRHYDRAVIRQHIVEHYSYDQIARKYISLYERIMIK